MIVAAWIMCLAWSVPPFFGWGAYIPEGLQVSRLTQMQAIRYKCIIMNGKMYAAQMYKPLEFREISASFE